MILSKPFYFPSTSSFQVTYMDADLRVARTRPDDQIFIYRRV